jgi:hypothetical protein
MPSTLTTTIAIGGVLNASFNNSFNKAGQAMQRLSRQANAAHRSMFSFTKAFVGLSAGLYLLGRFNRVMKESIKDSQDEANILSTIAQIQKNNALTKRGGPEAYKTQTEEIRKQAVELEKQSGLYHTIFLKGAGILSQTRANTGAIMEMQPHIGNLLVTMHKMGKSDEELMTAYQGIGRAIKTGMTKQLTTAGVYLSENEKKQLKANVALNTSLSLMENVHIIMKAIDRTNAGMMAGFMKTLQGQALGAGNKLRDMGRDLQNAWAPIIYEIQILAAEILPMLTPYLTTLIGMANVQLKILLKYITDNKTQIKIWIKEGWQKLMDAFTWIAQNRKWLIQWLEKMAIAWAAWTFVIGPLTAAIGTFGVLLVGLSNPITLTALAIVGLAVAGWYVVKNWKEIGNQLMGIWDQLFGTPEWAKQYKKYEKDDKGNLKEVRRPNWMRYKDSKGKWHTKKEDNYAQNRTIVPKGLLMQGLEAFDTALHHWVDNDMVPQFKAAWKTLGDWFNVWGVTLIKNWKEDWADMQKWFTETLVPGIVSAFWSIKDKMNEYLLKPIDFLQGKWQDFLKSIGLNTAEGFGNGDGNSKGVSGGWGDNINHVWSPINTPLTGPSVAGGGYDDAFNAAGKASGIDPLMLKAIALQEGVNPRYFNPMGRSNDAGVFHYGSKAEGDAMIMKQAMVPYMQGLKGSPGQIQAVFDKYSPVGAKNDINGTNAGKNSETMGIYRKLKSQQSTVPITINSSPTYHIHGVHDEQQLAVAHRKHVEHLKDVIAEVLYEKDRRAYSSGLT